MAEIVFLKLGGSLITDKRVDELARHDIIAQMAAAIATARERRPAMQLVIGHGSGSFGHLYGSRYGTRAGVCTADDWYGFAATGDAAARLNRIVVAALLKEGLPAWSIQPGVALRCADGRVVAGPAETVALALERGVVPVVYGDVALDQLRGGTIASTEEIFQHLADHLHPARIVLAGEVNGIYSADPFQDEGATRIPRITPADFAAIAAGLGGSHGVDVTGGMRAKVEQAVAMVRSHPGLTVVVCSGLEPATLVDAICGEAAGTCIAM